MTRTPYLNEMVAWDELLSFLGHKPASAVLPHRGACPLCPGRLVSYKCTTGRGEWHYCPDCRFAGDNIELACAAWAMPVESVARRLACLLHRDQPGDAEAYAAGVVGRRRQVAALWAEAMDYFPRSGGECRSVRSRLGVPADVPHRVWLERGGRHIGGLSRRDIELLLFNKDRSDRHFNLFPNPRKPGWCEGVIIPLFDLPGRITSLAVVCGHPRRSLEQAHRFVSTLPGCHNHHSPGLCVAEALAAPPGQLGDRVLVCTDPAAALRIHIRQLSAQSELLPIVGIWGPADTPQQLAEAAATRPMIVWGLTLSADVFRHAAALDAEVASDGGYHEDLQRRLGQRPPRIVVQSWYNAAVPWAVALERRLAALAIPEAEALLAEVKLSPPRLERFLAGCAAANRDRVEAVAGVARQVRKVICHERTVSETPDGWHARGWGSNRHPIRITDAPFRIMQVVFQPRVDETFYHGVVNWHGRQVPFTAPRDKFDSQPMGWLHHHLIAQDAGFTHYNLTWEPYALDIATALHKPQLLRGADVYGWDANRGSFVFPKFALLPGGRVEPCHDVTVGVVPAAHLLPPGGPGDLTDLDLAALHDDPLAWAVTLAVLAGLLAPLRGDRPWSVAVHGDGARQALRMALSLGCADNDLSTGWPSVHRRPDPGRLAGWLAGRPGCLVELSGLAALVAGTYDGWCVLEAPLRPALGVGVQEALAKLVPAFLHRLCRQGLIRGQPDGLWRRLVVEVNLWRKELGLGELSHQLPRLFAPSDNPAAVARLFGELVVRLFEDGALGFAHATFPIKYTQVRPRLCYYRGAVWIPKAGLNAILEDRRLPPLCVSGVSLALADSGALLESPDHEGTPGWVVPESWWNCRLRDYRARVRTFTQGKESA